MKIIEFPNVNIYSEKPKVFALGKFESLHIGHKEIFSRAREIANENGYELGIMIFNEREKDNILSLEERIMFLREYKPDYIMIFNRTKENFSKTKEEFEEHLKLINTKEVVIGEDFTYGNNREGDSQSISKIFKSNVVEDVKEAGEKVSTTRVFESINKADLEEYRKLMNHYFFYSGKVVKGLGNGKKFGMPTANVDYPTYKLDIHDGIFYSYVIYDGKRMPSLTSISSNPTLDAKTKTYETYIYDFDKDIYGEEIYVELIVKYRDPIKFNSIDELIEMLQKDKILGKEYFNTLKKGKI